MRPYGPVTYSLSSHFALQETDTFESERTSLRGAAMSRVRKIAIVALTVMSLASAWGWRWFTRGRFEETTDNAYLRGDITSIAPNLAGYVVEVDVDDNASVSPGAVLFHIDDSDYKAKVEQAKANVATCSVVWRCGC